MLTLRTQTTLGRMAPQPAAIAGPGKTKWESFHPGEANTREMKVDPITLEPDMLGSPTSVQDASRHASEPTAGQIVHSLVIVGFTHPMRACAWRARSAGVRVHLIELVERSRSFVLQSNAFDPDGITLEWSLVGTENGLAAIQRFAQSVQADALLTTDDFTLVWLGKHRGVLSPAAGCWRQIPMCWNACGQIPSDRSRDTVRFRTAARLDAYRPRGHRRHPRRRLSSGHSPAFSSRTTFIQSANLAYPQGIE